MSKIKTVLVTGSSGFIAKHIVLKLLNDGYNVVGSLRSLSRADEVIAAVTPHLNDDKNLDRRLRFVALDLTRDDGWDGAMSGIDALLHTASPFPLDQPKNDDDVVRPAVDGTLRALKAAQKAGVLRVVLTSSVAAITYGHTNDKKVFDQLDWTPLDQGYITPYTRSKTMAEIAAWDFVKSSAPEMQLSTINPALVLGAPLDQHYGTSLEIVERLLRASDPMLPQMGIGVVDVQDVAKMHVDALKHPDSIGQRLIGFAGFMTFKDLAETVKTEFPDRKTVTRLAPNILIRLMSFFDKSLTQVVPELGREFEVSTELSRKALDLTFIPTKLSVIAAARAIIAAKNI